MLDCLHVEIFEKHSIFPSFLNLRDLLVHDFIHFVFFDSLWCFHHFQMVRLHEKSESISRNILSSNFFASHHTVWSCFQVSSCMDLGRFPQLKSKHVRRNLDFGLFAESILGKQTTSQSFGGPRIPSHIHTGPVGQLGWVQYPPI